MSDNDLDSIPFKPQEADSKRAIFPPFLFADNKKKYVPTWVAFLLNIGVPLLILFLFSFLGAGGSGFLSQLEVILLAFTLCLTGILSRSKLRGLLLTIPAVWIVFLVFEFILSPLLGSSAYNPFEVVSVMGEPLRSAINNSGMISEDFAVGPLTVGVILDWLILIDLLLVSLLIFLFGGFFSAMVATGFWNKEGKLSVITFISKPIAAFFVILFLIVLPIIFHALSAGTGGASYLVAGFVDIMLAVGIDPNAAAAEGAQIPSIDDLDVDVLRKHSKDAAKNFRIANARLGLLKDNWVLGPIGRMVVEDYDSYTDLLGLTGSISDIVEVLPELFLTFISMQQGFNLTFSAIEASQSSFGSSGGTFYDPNFSQGITLLDYGIQNFSIAWNTSTSDGGLSQAIQNAKEAGLNTNEVVSSFMNVDTFFDALDVAVPKFFEVWPALMKFTNGTYKSMLGLGAVSGYNFENATAWINQAILDFISSNKTLSAIADVEPVFIEMTFEEGAAQQIPIPISEVIDVAKDLNHLLIPFSLASLNGIELFSSMEEIMTFLDALDMNNNSQLNDANTWAGINTALASTRSYYQNASTNIEYAHSLTGSYIATKDYGMFLQDPLVTHPNSVYNTIYRTISEYKGNVTTFGKLLDIIENTTLAFQAFSLATGQFDAAMDQYVNHTDSTQLLAVQQLYAWARVNASQGWNALNDPSIISSFLNEATRDEWKAILSSNDPSVYELGGYPLGSEASSTGVLGGQFTGICPYADAMYGIISDVIDLGSDPDGAELIRQLMNNLNLSAIFG